MLLQIPVSVLASSVWLCNKLNKRLSSENNFSGRTVLAQISQLCFFDYLHIDNQWKGADKLTSSNRLMNKANGLSV